MATFTSYLNLEKPTTSETFNLLKMNQNWDKIDNGVSALNSKFTIEPVESDTILIPAGERSQVTIPVSKSGYTPVGILAVYTTQTQVMSITSFYVSGSNAIVALYNNYGEARDGKMIVRVLYTKNT